MTVRLHARVSFACLREAASAKAGLSGVLRASHQYG
jgi:hypothetical protein